jgi:putative adhesin
MTSDTRATAIDHVIGPRGHLDVKLAARDIRIVPSADDHVRVRSVDGRAMPEDIKVEATEGSLSIREAGRFLGVSFSVGDASIGRNRTANLEVEVPVAAETIVQTASGSISASGLTGEQVYRTASGEVTIDGAAGRITAESVSGDMNVGVHDPNELLVKTVSGDVAIRGDRVERVRVTTTSGDIELITDLGSGPHSIETLSGDALIATNSGVRIQARTISGDLRSDLPHTADGMMGRRSLTVGDGAVELSFRSVSGDLRVVDPAMARTRTRVAPAAPVAPTPPTPPTPPTFPTSPAVPSGTADAVTAPPGEDPESAAAGPHDDRRLEILRALERGEIDIAAATDQLARLDESSDG